MSNSVALSLNPSVVVRFNCLSSNRSLCFFSEKPRLVAIRKMIEIIKVAFAHFLGNKTCTNLKQGTVFGGILETCSFPGFDSIPAEFECEIPVPICFDFASHLGSFLSMLSFHNIFQRQCSYPGNRNASVFPPRYAPNAHVNFFR